MVPLGLLSQTKFQKIPMPATRALPCNDPGHCPESGRPTRDPDSGRGVCVHPDRDSARPAGHRALYDSPGDDNTDHQGRKALEKAMKIVDDEKTSSLETWKKQE